MTKFFTHSRYLITLRAGKQKYHSILLFRLAGSSHDTKTQLESAASKVRAVEELQMYAMEAQCPHLGADLSHAEIEEYEDEVVTVCPWHRYNFNLKTGRSDTGLRACVYGLQIREEPLGEGPELWVESPSNEEYEVVELRPVSEAFADINNIGRDPPIIQNPESTSSKIEEPVVPTPAPTTLLEWAVLILNTPDAVLKVQRTRHAVELFRTGGIKSIGRHGKAPTPPTVPPRDAGMMLVDPTKVAKRGKGGSLRSRITMLHALANIEQWAIDLAWDIIARFGNDKSIPSGYYIDFTRMALDEAKHFTLLSNRLSQLGTQYGSLPIHSSLWQSALNTSDSLLARLAIIHLVHEARGLDVNPATIAKFEKAGDTESVALLEVIHLDEITHVTTGHRWFTWKCDAEGQLDPVSTFRSLVRERFQGPLKGPFNIEDRRKAGLGQEFYEDLVGGEGAAVSVGYEESGTGRE